MKYRIRFFSDFCSSETCKNKFEETCQVKNLSNYGAEKDIYFVTDESYTHAIILNKAMPTDLKIEKEKVIGLACEPYEFLHVTDDFVKYAKQQIGKYFIGDKRDLPDPFIEGFGYMWHVSPEKRIESKSKIMSIVISQKTFAPGHLYRHHIVNNLLLNNLPVDIYGRGCHMHESKPNIKGEFKEVEPYEDYLFTICIENFQNNHYISEKIMTPLMYDCTPIYIGCKNIKEYFDEVILLTGELEKDMNIIVNILNDPLKYYMPTCSEKNRKKVNIVENIEQLFS
jgi:hypothetical protein